MKLPILSFFVIVYSLFFINESYYSYIKFQRESKKNLNKTLTNLPPNRTADAILKEFSEFKIDQKNCPENFILIPEATNPNNVPIRQVIEYSFNPCSVTIANLESLNSRSTKTLILGAKEKVINIISSYKILKTSTNYILFQDKQ